MRHPRIECRPDVMLGKPVVKGTRVPVELILTKLAAGATDAELLDADPRRTVDDVRASFAYPADVVGNEPIRFGPSD